MKVICFDFRCGEVLFPSEIVLECPTSFSRKLLNVRRAFVPKRSETVITISFLDGLYCIPNKNITGGRVKAEDHWYCLEGNRALLVSVQSPVTGL